MQNNMKKKNNKTLKDILFLFISSFVLVVAWVGFSIYHKMVTTTISEDLQIQIKPIDPYFDSETIQKLKARAVIVPLYQLPEGIEPTTSETDTESKNTSSPNTQTKNTLTVQGQ
jgi:hypothetical protein